MMRLSLGSGVVGTVDDLISDIKPKRNGERRAEWRSEEKEEIYKIIQYDCLSRYIMFVLTFIGPLFSCIVSNQVIRDFVFNGRQTVRMNAVTTAMIGTAR